VRALGVTQFAAHAAGQITVAEQILAGHRPAGRDWCSCGRELPCSVTERVIALRDRYQQRLADLDRTIELPVVPAVPGPRRAPWWRRWGGRR